MIKLANKVDHGLPGKIVTEFKLILLATCQANKSGDEVLGQRTVTLFGKPAGQENSPKNHLNHLESRPLIH